MRRAVTPEQPTDEALYSLLTPESLDNLTEEQVLKMSPYAKRRMKWLLSARPNQIPPPGKWDVFLALAGRGWGKSRCGAEDVAYYGITHPGCRIALVAPTYHDARDTMVEGDSGLLKALPEDLVGSGWNRSLGELKLKNGTIYQLFSAEKPDALRGPQFHRAWCDELAQFSANGGDADYTWSMLRLCLRLGKHPQCIVTTTPLPLSIIKDLIADPKTYVVTGSTYENKDNLAPAFIDAVIKKYEGTRLGEQELYAKILDDVPGALWQREWIDRNRILDKSPEEVAKLCTRIVVAIDPATTTTKESDLTGIVVAGADEEGRGYILADSTCKKSPKEWATVAIDLYKRFGADRIIGETNNGGDMVEHTLRSVDENIPFKKVVASRGKTVRAEPVASLYEQNRISHVGKYELLENEMCGFTPENILKNSPNRADSAVWGLTELFGNSLHFGLLSVLREQEQNRIQKATVSEVGKVAVNDKTQKCPECGSAALARVFGVLRCNQCGAREDAPKPEIPSMSRNDLAKVRNNYARVF